MGILRRTTVCFSAAVAGTALLGRTRSVLAAAPELRGLLTWVPLAVSGRTTLAIGRKFLGRETDPVPETTVERRLLPSGRNQDGIPAYIYTPAAAAPGQGRGSLLWIHGGGTIAGNPETDHDFCSQLARDCGIVVVSVGYRLAPENPFPSGLHDCYDALAWLHDNAEELGCDRDRIAVGGASAGGGLAAALAQMAHDEAEVPVKFQLLVYPMLDDRTVLRRDHKGRGKLAWTPRSNRFAWTSYLGHSPKAIENRPYAAAARREDLSGLPPAWIGVGDLDLFHDENIDYARRLREAGVACELSIEPRMQHGADVGMPTAPSMLAFRQRITSAVSAALSLQRADTGVTR